MEDKEKEMVEEMWVDEIADYVVSHNIVNELLDKLPDNDIINYCKNNKLM